MLIDVREDTNSSVRFKNSDLTTKSLANFAARCRLLLNAVLLQANRSSVHNYYLAPRARGRVVYNLWHQVAEIMLGPRSCRVHNLCATCAQPVLTCAQPFAQPVAQPVVQPVMFVWFSNYLSPNLFETPYPSEQESKMARLFHSEPMHHFHVGHHTHYPLPPRS